MTPLPHYAVQALDIPDIIISVISLISSPQDQARFASINRCCYETCTVPRVRFVQLNSSETELWSFFRFIRRWKIAGLCHSLTIDSTTTPAITTFELCLISLILGKVGQSAKGQLRYLSATPIHVATEVPLDDEGLEHKVASSFLQLTAECNQLLDGMELDDQLYQDVRKLVSKRNVAEIDSSPKLFQDLSQMKSLEELDIGMRQQNWSMFRNEAYDIKALRLQIFRPLGLLQGSLDTSPSLHSMHRLETLKMHSLSGSEPIPIFQLTFPALRTFEISTSDPTEVPEDRTFTHFAHFIERHPQLQSVSLGENYVRSAGRLLQTAENLRALHLSLPFSGSVLSIPAALGAIPHLTHLRLSNAVASVLMFLKNSPARPKLPYFRCIELTCGEARDFKNLMRPAAGHEATFRIAQLWGLFPNIIEVAFNISFKHLSLFDILPTLLERLQECGKLRALRLRNAKPVHGVDAFPVSVLQKVQAIPPKLRYIVWENGKSTQVYELIADSNAEGRKVTRIPPLRSTPTKGRWSVDWHEESVFDHIAGKNDEE